ncbi:hypothetical protein HOY80DRAFT_1101756 [Tuber brumale]|nr:hypothetical protein HOY80DRAFT_1101756 [Tuber brumale]
MTNKMEEKTATPSGSSPTKFPLPRTPLQKAAVTVNALANSGYLEHFPGVTPEDIAYAGRIVKDLPLNISPNKHTLAFSMSTPMSLALSPELTAYAALQNEITAGAILKHWKFIKATRELETPVPLAKGAGDCSKVWDALEKSWGQKVAEDAWFEYINGEGKEGEGSGSGDQGGRPWKRTSPDSMPIGGAVSMSDGSSDPKEGTSESAGLSSVSIIEVVAKSGEIEGAREEPKKRAAPDPTPISSADSPTPTHKRPKHSALEQSLLGDASHEVS